jgi:predicted butyrate kinase (DUF1464 family)
MQAMQRGDLLDVFTNPKVIALLTDPEIRGALNQADIGTAFSSAPAERETASERQ